MFDKPRTLVSRAGTALGRCQVAGLHAVAVWVTGALVVSALLLLPVGAGLWLLPPTARRLRALSDRSRTRAAKWTGLHVSGPEPPHGDVPARDARARARAVLADEGFWRDLAWAWVEPLVGGLLVAVPLALVEYGAFGVLVQPFIWRLLGDGNWYAFVPVHDSSTVFAALALGLALMATGLLMAPAVLRLHARTGRPLLSASRGARLARRVEHLADTRARAVDTLSAELRRIERDLHDGAQARLVALGMTVDRATRLLETDPGAARELLLDVRTTSEQALADLRALVHGIHPPILTDRGLGDAIRSLALDSFLDVHVEARLPGRFAAPVESAAYFAVSEALANAAKHSAAREVRIVLTHAVGLLRATVTDDGRGGADPSRGTGLLGVRRRLDTFDGTLTLHSPHGGPTTLTMEIPCALSSPKTSSC
ncbi:sensor domain-containing protein [Streptomyces diacarni]|uniref:sensor histidine kinase n=1 Tax=Streptomyces diacarni TaxID=2800381 RepID=UPI0033F18982